MVQSITSQTLGTITQPPVTREFRLNGNLNWLEQTLIRARLDGKSIIINMHKPDMREWNTSNIDARNRFNSLLSQHGVKGIFAGHYHLRNGYYNTLGGVPIFLSGSASQSTYLIAEYDNLNLKIFLVTNNNWRQKKLVDTISLQSDNSTNPQEPVEPEPVEPEPVEPEPDEFEELRRYVLNQHSNPIEVYNLPYIDRVDFHNFTDTEVIKSYRVHSDMASINRTLPRAPLQGSIQQVDLRLFANNGLVPVMVDLQIYAITDEAEFLVYQVFN